MSWDYELAKAMKGVGKSAATGTPLLEGTVVSRTPLTISLYGGEVMAPPAPLAVLNGIGDGYEIGDRTVCGWMGQTLVLLGRLEG